MTKQNGYGKRKGGAFEREIAVLLSLWVSKGERKDLYWRAAMSGGRATIQYKKGIDNKTQAGDLSCIDSSGEQLTNRYVIECKTYKNVHLDSIIYKYSNKTDCVFNWWETLKSICIVQEKEPLLIFKQNGRPILIGMFPNKNTIIKDKKLIIDDMLITDFRSFLSNTSFEEFIGNESCTN